jgi:biopolymer transport protein ExbD
MSRTIHLCLALLVSATLCACGSETALPKSDEEGSQVPEGKIAVTTKNGRTLEFSDFEVACHPTIGDQDAPPAQGFTVSAVAGSNDMPGISRREPRLHLEAADVVVDGVAVSLPYPDIEETEDTPPISVYVSRTGGRPIELSSVAEESFGEIEVIKAACEPKPHIELRIDANLHSELFDGGRAEVRGHVQGG